MGKLIQYHTEVLHIETRHDGVRVSVRDLKTGVRSNIKADYCISNIPLPILRGSSNNFAEDFKDAVACVYDPTCKLGWQANQRFWENNQNQIYGGISYTTIRSHKCGIRPTTISRKTER